MESGEIGRRSQIVDLAVTLGYICAAGRPQYRIGAKLI
jgi:hypothetical protein